MNKNLQCRYRPENSASTKSHTGDSTAVLHRQHAHASHTQHGQEEACSGSGGGRGTRASPIPTSCLGQRLRWASEEEGKSVSCPGKCECVTQTTVLHRMAGGDAWNSLRCFDIIRRPQKARGPTCGTSCYFHITYIHFSSLFIKPSSLLKLPIVCALKWMCCCWWYWEMLGITWLSCCFGGGSPHYCPSRCFFFYN